MEEITPRGIYKYTVLGLHDFLESYVKYKKHTFVYAFSRDTVLVHTFNQILWTKIPQSSESRT